MTNEDHNKYIAWSFLAYGGIQLLFVALFGAMFFAMMALPGRPGEPGPPMAFFGFFFGIMVVVQSIFTAPAFIAAYGLLKRKSWARVASIVAGILSSMSVPIGTAACVYALWFFFGDQWKSVYTETGGGSRRDPLSIAPARESKWDGYATDEEGAHIYRTPPPPDWR